VKSTPVAPEPYEAILSSEDPIRALRERVGQPFAEAIFIQLHAAGRRDLSMESLIVETANGLGVPRAIVDLARGRLDFYEP
jgi:hypothetical protein